MNKEFYYVMSGFKNFKREYIKLFNHVFKKVGESLDPETNKKYLIFKSNLFFSTAVETVFGVESLNKAVSYTEGSGVVSNCRYTNNDDDTDFYRESVIGALEVSVKNENQEEEIDFRPDEDVHCFYALSNPYLKDRLNRMCEISDVAIRDIEIVLAYMPDQKGMLGGYVSKRRASEDTITLSKQLRPFQLPVILINIAASQCQVRENILEVVVHELRHFVDDIMVIENKADPSTMPEIPEAKDSSSAETIRYWNQYLTSPTEINAHASEIVTSLEAYTAEYVQRNYVQIKDQVLRRIMVDDMNDAKRGTDSGYQQYSLYAAIFDQAYQLYINQSEKTG